MSASDKKLHFHCMHCGSHQEAVWKKPNLFTSARWVAEKCSTCHKENDLTKVEVVSCPHCKETVLKNDPICVCCGKPIAFTAEDKPIPCPSCGQHIYLPKNHKGDYTCDICQAKLTESYIKRMQIMGSGSETVSNPLLIKLPDEAQLRKDKIVVYRHDMNSFPFKSRMIVSENTYALLLQNGVCLPAYGPGSYPLEESDLTREERFNSALNNNDIVFNTDIFCVRKNLPEILWGNRTTLVAKQAADEDFSRKYHVTINGSVLYQVEDPKAFVSQHGFEKTTDEAVSLAANRNETNGWLKDKTNAAVLLTYESVCQSVLVVPPPKDKESLDACKQKFIVEMTAALNKQMEDCGVCVQSLNCNIFNIEETPESVELGNKNKTKKDEEKAKETELKKQKEQLLDAAQKEFSWKAENIEVHLKDRPLLQATLSFSGSLRLKVDNEDTFFNVSEMKAYLANATQDTADQCFKSKAESLLHSHLGSLVQELINRDRIQDVQDRFAYREIRTYVQDTLNDALHGEGLQVQSIYVNLPTITLSKALQSHLTEDDRKEKLIHFAESSLHLKTEPIQLHAKEDASIFLKATFAAVASLRIENKDVFFETSEVKNFISSDPFVSSAAVNDYYTKRINSLFGEVVASLAQSFIDHNTLDIRELNRVNLLLKNTIDQKLNERVALFGMKLTAVDMLSPTVLEKSANMELWLKKESQIASTSMQKEIDTTENDYTIFQHEEDNRVQVSNATSDSKSQHTLDGLKVDNMESHDRIDEKEDELRRRKAERAHAAEMNRLRKEEALNRIKEDYASERKERKQQEELKDQKHGFTKRDNDINQGIHEDALRQQGTIDAEARKDKAEFERLINTAENKRAIQDIMHKIDESDLDWQKKLDEYKRLSHRLSVEDQAEEDLLLANTKAEKDKILSESAEKIKREQDETYYIIGTNKIKLNEAQEELLEKVARYKEDRAKRIADDNAARQEQQSKLAFDQQMKDQQEKFKQQIELLEKQHEHDLAIRDRDDKLAELYYELEKYKYERDHLVKIAAGENDVEKARIKMSEEVRKAEAEFNVLHEKEKIQAEERREQQRIQQEESVAKRVEEFRKELMNIFEALEKMRLENERNRDNKKAEVSIAQADALNSAAFAEFIKTQEELLKKLDKLIEAGKKKEKKTKTQPQNPFVPAVPPFVDLGIGGTYGYNRTDGFPVSAPSVAPVSGAVEAPSAKAPASSHQKVCPICNTANSMDANICSGCSNPIY